MTLPSRLSAKMFVGSSLLVSLCALSGLACSSNSTPTPAPAAPTANDSGVTNGAQVTFTEVYNTILGPICSTCHKPGGLGSFQDFSSQASAYAALVGVKADGPACGSSGETRVVAGNASQSLMFQKVSQATPPCGSRMPLGGTPLSSTEQTLIEDWINGGAHND